MHNGNTQGNGNEPHQPEPITEYRLTLHAARQMAERRIREGDVTQVLAQPEQIELVLPTRWVYQSRFALGEPPKTYLIRVFVDIDEKPPAVVTVIRTSNIKKYWRDV
ncbi:MAG: hypothetical protein DLM69_04560 [Candidatus Chloroheliales bacterium]|nr:MAG: hypothetical protein DLM69_04560 [Chloroflexota bacterium]